VKSRFTRSAQTAGARLVGIEDIGVGAACRTCWYAVSQVRFQLIKSGQRNAGIISGKLVLRAFDDRKISRTFPAFAIANSLGYAKTNGSCGESTNDEDDENLKEGEPPITFVLPALPYSFFREPTDTCALGRRLQSGYKIKKAALESPSTQIRNASRHCSTYSSPSLSDSCRIRLELIKSAAFRTLKRFVIELSQQNFAATPGQVELPTGHARIHSERRKKAPFFHCLLPTVRKPIRSLCVMQA
jgi:hypothetical protein